jgi:ABC-type lipoprotein export system ATPase subunit
MLISTHSAALAARFDHIFRIADGKIAAAGMEAATLPTTEEFAA